jgi:TetR/AcrR family fatty acid metabolism transcriptional regulator
MMKMTKRKDQAIKTKSMILEAGIRMINEFGYENVTVDKISKACGISKGAFYHHFTSKLDIVSEVEARVNETIEGSLEACVDEDIEERILIFLNSMIDAVEKSGLELTRQRSKFVLSGEYIHNRSQTSYGIRSTNMMKELLKDAVNKGELKIETPVNLLVDQLMTVNCGLISNWCIFNGEYSLSERSWQLTMPLVHALIRPYKAKQTSS